MMTQIAPAYYPQFHCIADRCRHSCCIGWEIDVDEETLETYRTLPGPMGEEIRASIVTDGETPHFALREQDRCPFLNEQGLCRMIMEYGEDVLCEICREHPRFYNAYPDTLEVGLGLSCEAAAQLILSQQEPLHLISISGAPIPEHPLRTFRSQLLELLEDAEWTFDERLQNILDLCGMALPDLNWTDTYRALERLDSAWDTVLDTLSAPTAPIGTEWDRPFINLTSYFLYRHIPAALNDDQPELYAAFAVLSTAIIRRLFAAAPRKTLDALAELCRLYSSEIEYSPENTDTLLDLLWEHREIN